MPFRVRMLLLPVERSWAPVALALSAVGFSVLGAVPCVAGAAALLALPSRGTSVFCHLGALRFLVVLLSAAWGVHIFTASGVVFAFLALLAVYRGNARETLMWLGIALVVDGVDGPLARMFRVKDVLPRLDGTALDLVVDYLT